MIKNILSMIIGGFILFLGVYIILMLGNDKFSLEPGTAGVNADITGKNVNLLGLLTFLLIFGFIILMVLFGNNLISLNLRYSEQFVGGDKEEFLSSISCSKKLKEDKAMPSTIETLKYRWSETKNRSDQKNFEFIKSNGTTSKYKKETWFELTNDILNKTE